MFNNCKNKGLSGLQNMGNTCFINSCFQIISHTYELNEILNKIDYNKSINNNNDSVLLIEWNNLRDMLWSENCVITPNRFINTIQKLAVIKNIHIFSDYYQNDITEFIVFIINCFHNALSREVNVTINGKTENETDVIAKKSYEMISNIYSKEYSEIFNIFYGIQITIIENINKDDIKKDDINKSYIPEIYSILSLPIPNIKNPTLIDCFNLFAEGEIMEGDNAVFNEETNEKEKVKKHIKFWNFPNVLIIDLKRYFSHEKKNKVLVTFPLEKLDLSDYVIGYNKNSYIYDLYGICNHTGSNLGGHYTSIIKNIDTWYKFDDTIITKITNINDIITQEAYCFFYRKVT
jgi:ubiquitin C-terminal hydrolase